MLRETKLGNEKLGKARALGNSPSREAIGAILLALVATSPLWAASWLAERQQAVEKMSPAEKQDLNDEYKKFLALSTDQQDQLRALNRNLENDPQGERLRGVMHRYYDWLKTLRPDERADLLSLPLADRPARIKSLKQRQEAFAAKLPAGSHLTPQDVQVLSDWVKTYAAAHEAELVKDFPAQRRGDFPGNEKFPGNDKAPRERPRQFTAWRPWLGPKLPNVSKEEMDDLAHQLSPEPRKVIDSRPTLPEKIELIHEWLQAIWRQRAGGGGFGRHGRNVGPKELARFFENDLSKEEQDKLSHITDKDEQHRELQRLFLQHRRASESSTGAGGGADQHPTKSGPKASPANPEKDSEASPPKQPLTPPDATTKTPDSPKT
jgi:hypothetical protein